MTTNRNRAAEIIGREYMDAMSGPTPSAWRGQIVEALDDAGLLADDILEYRIEHQHIDNGVWHPLTQWSPEWPLNDGHSVAPDERIVCRRVSHPWEVTDV